MSGERAGAVPGVTPRVSVVIPAFDAEPYLDESIRSVRDQTLRDIEILVVDDGSRDASLETAERHAAEDPRVRVLRQEHGGVSAARNLGIGEARASWVALQDADDVSLPLRLERQLACLEANPDVAALGTYATRIGSTGREFGVLETTPTSRDELAAAIAREEPLFLLPSTVMMSREAVVASGGFRTATGVAEDADLWTRLADRHAVLVLPEPLVRYRVHGRTLSSRRFHEQTEAGLRAGANGARRRAGLPELTPAEFHEVLRRQPLIERLRRAADWQSRYCYRVGSGLLADRRPAGVLWLALAVIVQPGLMPQRARRAARWLRTRGRARTPVTSNG